MRSGWIFTLVKINSMSHLILVHHHIFKNAGTSFNHALKQNFGANFLEFDLPKGEIVTQDILDDFITKNPQALAISGHHICLPTPQGENYQTISSILLRKPLARIRSIYNFERKQDAQTSGAIKAKELNFKEFVEWRLATSPFVFCNYQTLYCSRTDKTKPKYIPTEKDLELAIRNLSQCTVVGTVERYQESLEIANERLKEFFPDLNLAYVHKNVTSKSVPSDKEIREGLVEDLGEDMVAKLEEMNQLDEQLYKVADVTLSNQITNETTVSN